MSFTRVRTIGAALLVLLLITFSSLSADQPGELEKIVSLEKLKSTGDDWGITYQDIEADNGRVTLRHDNWLMYFLHWRPLTDSMRNLSVAYVEHHLLNFWGESMPFDLSGNTGPITVCGHDGYFVDGSLWNDKIRTRFIVWNCEATGRQFTADCNINRDLLTAEKYLPLQEDITHTICCHDGCPETEIREGWDRYFSTDWDISFDKPAYWRTSDYVSQQWYSEGMSNTNGSLWTLLTNSQKHIELSWRNAPPTMYEGLMQEMFDDLLLDSLTRKDSAAIGSYVIDTTYSVDGRLKAEGRFVLEETFQGTHYTDGYRFEATLWTKDNRTYLLVAALFEQKDVWGIPNDLSPSDETMGTFIIETVETSVLVY